MTMTTTMTPQRQPHRTQLHTPCILLKRNITVSSLFQHVEDILRGKRPSASRVQVGAVQGVCCLEVSSIRIHLCSLFIGALCDFVEQLLREDTEPVASPMYMGRDRFIRQCSSILAM